jgi:2-oxo-3-hexenedioate decarboxylase
VSGHAQAPLGKDAEALLAAHDAARLLPLITAAKPGFALADAFGVADRLRSLRIARGEQPFGYKIGFTNRSIWDRYGVHAPIWGPIWNTTVEFVDDGEASVSLAPFVQPRLEPEIMFGFARQPRAGMSEAELAGTIEWVAHGYEIVHTHFADWRFKAADCFADFALHGRLFVGRKVPIAVFADPARELAALHVALHRDGELIDEGDATIVLDGPLSALRIWVDAMAAQPQHWPIRAGDIVTTGTITDAAPMLPGHRFHTQLSDARLPGIALRTEA